MNSGTGRDLVEIIAPLGFDVALAPVLLTAGVADHLARTLGLGQRLIREAIQP